MADAGERMEAVPCNLCGADDPVVRHEIRVDARDLRFYRFARFADPDLTGTMRIVACRRCGLLYVSPRLSEEQLARVYGDNRVLGGVWRSLGHLFRPTDPDDLQDPRNAPPPRLDGPDWRFERIERHTAHLRRRPLTLLDVGCGRGEFVARALRRGYEAIGVDRAPDRVDLGRRVPGLAERLVDGDALRLVETFSGRTFDVITLWDVVEHVTDPLGLMRSVRALCHAESRVFVYTMSTDSRTYRVFGKRWYYVHPAIHLYYFSDATLADLLARAGLALEAKETDDSHPPTVWRLAKATARGLLHRLAFRIWARPGDFLRALRPVLRPLHRGIDDERMALRVANLHPGFYTGRFQDDFVYVARMDQAPDAVSGNRHTRLRSP